MRKYTIRSHSLHGFLSISFVFDYMPVPVQIRPDPAVITLGRYYGAYHSTDCRNLDSSSASSGTVRSGRVCSACRSWASSAVARATRRLIVSFR